MARVLLLGYGRMGKMIEGVLQERGHVVGHIHGRESQLNQDTWASCDVAIEFSIPAVAEELCRQALSWKIPTVSGSTGWDVRSVQQFATEQSNRAFLHGTNMSIGVNAVFAANRLLTKVLHQAGLSHVTISETHHVHKLDQPSGTAITLAEGVLSQTDRYTSWALQSPQTPEDALPIASIREGEVYGNHELSYTTEVEEVRLLHHATSRRGFALGAVLAAEFLLDKSGVYTMADVLGIP